MAPEVDRFSIHPSCNAAPALEMEPLRPEDDAVELAREVVTDPTDEASDSLRLEAAGEAAGEATGEATASRAVEDRFSTADEGRLPL